MDNAEEDALHIMDQDYQVSGIKYRNNVLCYPNSLYNYYTYMYNIQYIFVKLPWLDTPLCVCEFKNAFSVDSGIAVMVNRDGNARHMYLTVT